MAEWDESKHKRDRADRFAEQEEKKQALRKIYESDPPHSKKGEIEQPTRPSLNVQLFAAKNYSGWGTREMKKSIRSHQKTIALHEDKIRNPEKYVPGWNNLNDIRRKQIVNGWKKEIFNYSRDISRIEDELKKRGES